MEEKSRAKKGLLRLFNHPENRHNFELFHKFLSQSPRGLVLCQVLPEERLKVIRFFNEEPLKERIYMIDMVQPLCGPMQLQQSILEAYKKYGDKKNIFFIYNFESCIYLSKTSAKKFFQKLNLIRDFFMGLDAVFVFFMTASSIKSMIRYAFDFYDWMAFTFTFVPEGFIPELLLTEIIEKSETKYSAPYKKIEYLKKSIEGTPDEKEKSLKLTELADLYIQIGDYDASLERILAALDIDEKNNDHQHTANDYNKIGMIFQYKGDYDAALKQYEKSLEIHEKIGDKAGEGTNLNNISQVYSALGDYDTALKYLEQSLKIFKNIGDRSKEGTILNNISQIYDARGDYDTALKYLEQSLKIFQDIGDKSNEGTTLNNISSIYHTRGDYDTALKYLEQSLKIEHEINDKAGEGTTLNNISSIYHARGDYETALKYLEQSLKISQEIGDKSGSIPTLHNMALIALENNDMENFMEYETTAYQIAKEAKDAMGIYNVGKHLGTFLIGTGKKKEGIELLKQSIEIGKAAGFPDVGEIEKILWELGE
jgi:tetratricopeptide (TPR) repeat protein